MSATDNGVADDHWLMSLAEEALDDLDGLLELDDESLDVLQPGFTIKSFVEALVEGEHFTDALQLIAHLLPPREGVAWACYCARSVLPDDPDPVDVEALDAAESWVREPTEEAGRAAEAAAEPTEMETAAGMTAMAAFWSGDNIAPIDVPPIEPEEDMAAKGIGGAVLLAAVDGEPEPEELAKRFGDFVSQGMRLAAHSE